MATSSSGAMTADSMTWADGCLSAADAMIWQHSSAAAQAAAYSPPTCSKQAVGCLMPPRVCSSMPGDADMLPPVQQHRSRALSGPLPAQLPPASPHLSMSYTRPGVPTTTCTPPCRMRVSSRTLVPPTQAWQRTLR